MNSVVKMVAALLAVTAVGASAQGTSLPDRPSWRTQADTPQRPTLPPVVERPEFEFSVGRESLARPSFEPTPIVRRGNAREAAESGAAPELGRVGTARERRAAARREAGAARAASTPEPVAEPAVLPAAAGGTLATGGDVVAVQAPDPVPAPDGAPEALVERTQQRAAAAEPAGLRPISRVAPDYPRRAWLDGDEGWVDVEFAVDPDGGVEAVRVVAAEPRRTFEKAALRAASDWRFEPPASGEEERMVFRFEFRMDG